MTVDLDDLRADLVNLKRKPFPRCSTERIGLIMDPPETWAEVIENHVAAEALEDYLRGFVAPNEKGERPCPKCGHGFFGWGLVHGAGSCACGWPGTLYHYVRNLSEDDDVICADEKCRRSRGDHVPTEKKWQTAGSDSTRIVIELRCPDQEWPHSFRAPDLVRFSLLLWAHPYAVHLRD